MTKKPDENKRKESLIRDVHKFDKIARRENDFLNASKLEKNVAKNVDGQFGNTIT